MTSSVPQAQIVERIIQIRQSLPAAVKLIAVTKQVSVEAMRAAYAAGIRDFGESRIQEATLKQQQLHDLSDITWHFIGHLQSNKAAKAIAQFQWIHSLDNLKLAQRLNQLAQTEPGSKPPNLLLQVKILPDPSKFGWTVTELLADLSALEQCSYLNIVGLMTIPPYGLAAADMLAVFTQTRELAEKIRQQSTLPIQQLSMGMSEDYPLAVQAGATMIRLGRTLFGDRPLNP